MRQAAGDFQPAITGNIMSTAHKPLDVAQATGDVLAELEASFFDIPFENSDFQNRAFVVAAQLTPARAFRAVGLRMFGKIRALKEYEFSKRKREIDLEEKRWKIADPATDSFERRRLVIDAEQIEDEMAYSEKLKNDALRELDCLYAEFIRLPKYTRAQFEAEERAHFAASLNRQLTNNGASTSILNMEEDLPSMDARIANAISEMDRIKKLVT